MFDFQYEKTILIPSTVKDGKIIQSNGVNNKILSQRRFI